MRNPLQIGALLIGATALHAQTGDVFNARITNTASDRFKCTIEVVVDGVAEVDINGSQGRLRTISGQPATWRRMDCNAPLPANPIGFEFHGQEGRGRQDLLRSPDQTRGTAVVRIEDRDGGREGYKFDLEWRGSDGFDGGFGRGPGGGFGQGPGGGFGQGPGDGFGRGPGGGGFDYTERGEGYFRPARGAETRINRADISISRNGQVTVVLGNGNRNAVRLDGRIIHTDGSRRIVDIQSNAVRGTMEILVDRRGRVRELAMTGVGRNRAEVYWETR